MNNPKGTKLVQKVILSRKELRWSAQRRTTMFTFRLITTKVIWVKFEKSALSLPSLSTDWSYITQIQKSRTILKSQINQQSLNLKRIFYLIKDESMTIKTAILS